MSARPYKIEAQPLAQRYARGWHCLGPPAISRTASRTR